MKRVFAIVIISFVAFMGSDALNRVDVKFNPIDESAHFDYVSKLSSGQIPKWGDLYEQDTIYIADCLGSSVAVGPTDCSIKQRNPLGFAPQGYSYEVQQPPLGYIAFLPAYYLTQNLAPLDRIQSVRRWGGMLSYIVAVVLLIMIARKTRLSWFGSIVMSSLILLSPVSINAFSTVTNDISALLVGVGYVLGLVSARDKSMKSAAYSGAIVGMLCALTKSFVFLLPLGGLLSLYLVFGVQKKSQERVRGVQSFLLASSIVSTISTLIYVLLIKLLSSTSPAVVFKALLGVVPTISRVSETTVMQAIVNMTNLWSGSSIGIVTFPYLFTVIGCIGIFGAGFATASESNPGTDDLKFRRLLIANWIITSLAVAIAVPVSLFMLGGYNFDAPARYGLMALPLVAVAVSQLFQMNAGVSRRH